jgi:hypothetical protein
LVQIVAIPLTQNQITASARRRLAPRAAAISSPHIWFISSQGALDERILPARPLASPFSIVDPIYPLGSLPSIGRLDIFVDLRGCLLKFDTRKEWMRTLRPASIDNAIVDQLLEEHLLEALFTRASLKGYL